MADEIKPPIVTEGKPVDSMSSEEAKAEIDATFQDPNYMEGNEGFGGRQTRVKRMTELHRKAYPELVEKDKMAKESGTMNRPLFDYLTERGVDQETLEEDAEKRAEEADKKAMAETKRKLESEFGGEEEAKRVLRGAKDVLKRFAKPADLQFLEKTGLGNDPGFIKKLAEIGEIFKRARRGKK
jgi:hypothetical protein